MRVEVDRDLCQGHGVCTRECPEVFELDANDELVIKMEEPPEELREKVGNAVNYCPNSALTLND